MSDLRTAWSAAVGQAPLREVVEARRGMDRATVRRVRRAVRRGETADNAREARLAVAIAHDLQRQQRVSGPKTMAFFALIVVLWAGMAISLIVNGNAALGVFFAAFAVWGIWLLAVRGRWQRNAEQAERANLELLERCGEPYQPPADRDARVERPRGVSLVLGVVATFVFYVAGFGTLTTLMDGETLTIGRVVASGLLFGVLMTIFNLTWGRKRSERAAQRT